MSDKRWKSIEKSNRDVQDPEVLRGMLDETQADLRESQAREAALTQALRGLLREEPNVYEGRLEASLYVSVDALEAAQAALASPSDAAAKLLERVAELEHELEDCGGPVHCKEGAEKDRADRDRWLGHCRKLLDSMPDGFWDGVAEGRAARRDLEQHDAGRKGDDHE